MTQIKDSLEGTLDIQEPSVFEKYQKAILTAVVACVVLVGGYFAYKYLYLEPRNEEGSAELAKGQQLFAMGDYEQALKGDASIQFKGYVALASEYSGTDAGNLANLYAGLSLAQQDKAKEAIPYLEAFDPQGDGVISAMGVQALGQCYATAGQVDKAVETLKKAATMGEKSIASFCLLEAGQLLETQGKKAEALALYEQIKKDYYETAAAQEIDKYIQRASN